MVCRTYFAYPPPLFSKCGTNDSVIALRRFENNYLNSRFSTLPIPETSHNPSRAPFLVSNIRTSFPFWSFFHHWWFFRWKGFSSVLPRDCVAVRGLHHHVPHGDMNLQFHSGTGPMFLMRCMVYSWLLCDHKPQKSHLAKQHMPLSGPCITE